MEMLFSAVLSDPGTKQDQLFYRFLKLEGKCFKKDMGTVNP